MGLDMYAFTTREQFTKPVDFPDPQNVRELHSWRKHPNLHGWMEQLYRQKGGTEPEFNWAPVSLDLQDLDQLEAAILANRLPHTEGFFFGESDGSERDDDLAFVDKARILVAKGETVYYVSSW